MRELWQLLKLSGFGNFREIFADFVDCEQEPKLLKILINEIQIYYFNSRRQLN